jgi:hypothetical protein
MSIAEWIYSWIDPWEDGSIQAQNLDRGHTRWGIGPWHSAIRHRRTGEVFVGIGRPVRAPESAWELFETI